MIKIDLHTHSIVSPDGGITAEQYRQALDIKKLDVIAITDHNRIDFALKMHTELGPEKIIVGEEINTNQGEIIGLFLNELVEPNQEINVTIEKIKSQGGLVYIPHPFETVRSGITRETLDQIKDDVDMIEGANGRAYFQNFGPDAHTWARLNNVASFASSDAHRAKALGKTYTELSELPTPSNLCELTKTARKFYNRPSLADILAPKLNRLKKVFGG